jgi:hypothetical protein
MEFIIGIEFSTMLKLHYVHIIYSAAHSIDCLNLLDIFEIQCLWLKNHYIQ